MFKRILIPTDGSPLAERAVAAGIALARSIGAHVTFFTCSEPFHVVAIEPLMVSATKEEYSKDAAAEARQVLNAAQDAARAAGVPSDAVHSFNDRPYEAIIAAAASRECDAILMASHGRKGVTAALLGSQTQKVLSHCKTPVIVWR